MALVSKLNVLINDTYNAIITDFGSARAIFTDSPKTEIVVAETATLPKEQELGLQMEHAKIDVSDDYLTLTGQHGTLRWSAPELLLEEVEHPNLSTDIWAFGWICWEVGCHSIIEGSAN